MVVTLTCHKNLHVSFTCHIHATGPGRDDETTEGSPSLRRAKPCVYVCLREKNGWRCFSAT
eukprot:471602-Amorphochlora_amoeboformis.AAC.1